MATNRARGGFGTKLYRGDGAVSEAFTLVGDTLDFSGPNESHMIEDATHMESTDGWAEKVAIGVKEAGSLSFDVHWVSGDAMQGLIRSDMIAGTRRNWRLLLPGGTHRIAFTALVESMSRGFPVKGKVTQSIVLAVTGAPTVEAVS